jgi:hypothetical protein
MTTITMQQPQMGLTFQDVWAALLQEKYVIEDLAKTDV